MKSDKLFVYGSLMGGIQSPIATYLKSNSDFLGIGYLSGALYDLGQYPGLVYEKNGQRTVTGHVFQLNNPIEMLPNLDHYECVGEGFEAPNEYIREIVPVNQNGAILNCWTYLYDWSTEGLDIIESGNYLAYFQQNEQYQKFVRSLNDFSRR